LLRSSNKRVQEESCITLRNLSANTDNQVKIVQRGALPALIGLMHSSNAKLQEAADITLRNCSMNSENEVRIVQDGGLPPLIALSQVQGMSCLTPWDTRANELPRDGSSTPTGRANTLHTHTHTHKVREEVPALRPPACCLHSPRFLYL